MQTDGDEIVLLGLNRAEALDLRRHQAEHGGARLEEQLVDRDSVGVLDPVTLIAIPLGALAIQALTAWLVKHRRDEVVEEEIEIRRPDGTVERRTLRIRRKDSTSPQHTAEILAALQVPLPGP